MDETKDPKDTSVRDSSVGTKGTSETLKTYTEESEKKAVQDALSAVGRDAKTLSDKTAEAERILTVAKKTQADIQAEQKRWQDERDEASRETVRDDPEALKSFNERIRQRDEATKLAKERTELDEKETKQKDDLEQIRVFKRTQIAAEIAVAKGVNIDALLKLTTEDSREAMEATAEMLPKTGEQKTPLKTDSSTTLGGGASFEQIRDEMIKNPSNDAKMKRYIEAKAERDKNK